MRAVRAMANRDDVMSAEEERGLPVDNLFSVQPRGPQGDENLVTIDVDLRQFVRLQGVIDRQCMQAIGGLEFAQLLLGRINEPDPDEIVWPVMCDLRR